jgi:hypothetical protein
MNTLTAPKRPATHLSHVRSYAGATLGTVGPRRGSLGRRSHQPHAPRHIAAVMPEMAVRLGKLYGHGAELWLRMQQARDLWLAERKLSDELSRIPTRHTA